MHSSISKVAAIPEDAVAIEYVPAALNAAKTVFRTKFSPVTPTAFKKKHFDPLYSSCNVALTASYTYLCSRLKDWRH